MKLPAIRFESLPWIRMIPASELPPMTLPAPDDVPPMVTLGRVVDVDAGVVAEAEHARLGRVRADGVAEDAVARPG